VQARCQRGPSQILVAGRRRGDDDAVSGFPATPRSTRRTRTAAAATPLGRAANGRALCRWCGNAVAGARRKTFCSHACVHEWKLRASVSYLRECVLARDHGVCAECGLDTIRLAADLVALRRRDRVAWRKHQAFLGVGSRRSYWDADHIVAVVAGGGECDLSNIRTLCVWCHKRATQRLRRQVRPNSPLSALPPDPDRAASPDAEARDRPISGSADGAG
jgi:5-methylcytosine-specific restriction protein A